MTHQDLLPVPVGYPCMPLVTQLASTTWDLSPVPVGYLCMSLVMTAADTNRDLSTVPVGYPSIKFGIRPLVPATAVHADVSLSSDRPERYT